LIFRGTKSLLDLCNCFHVIDMLVVLIVLLIKVKIFYLAMYVLFIVLQGGYPTCEVGLIMYNPNPSLGTFSPSAFFFILLIMQYIQVLYIIIPFDSIRQHNANYLNH